MNLIHFIFIFRKDLVFWTVSHLVIQTGSVWQARLSDGSDATLIMYNLRKPGKCINLNSKK